MTIEAINEQLLRAVGVGIALFDEQTLCVQFRNNVFVTWFGEGEPDETLASVFPELDTVAMRAAVDNVGRFTNELSFRKERRTLVIAQTFTRTTVGDHAFYVLLDLVVPANDDAIVAKLMALGAI